MTDRNELERLLAAANKGPWAVSAYYNGTGPDERCFGMIVSDDDMATGIIDENAAPCGDSLSHDLDLICFLRNNAQHYLSLMDEVEKLRRDRETLIEFAKSINSWRSDCDSYDRECSNPPRNYCEDVELMELSAGHALCRVNARQALGETK